MFSPQYETYSTYGPGQLVSKFECPPTQPGLLVADAVAPAAEGLGPRVLVPTRADPLIDPLTDPLTFPVRSITSSSTATGPAPVSYHKTPANPSHDTRRVVQPRMASIADDLAAQEAAAREFQPRLEGPLVGGKTPSHIITEEYAKADPVYVEKTISLPQTYSHYRPIQGDGNCGWRAIGFCYFEQLIHIGSKPIIDGEVERLRQLNKYLQTVGQYDPFTYEDMAEETVALLQEVSANIGTPDHALALVMEKFNSEDSSNAIIYHLRLLAASYLKGNAGSFAGFIPGDRGVEGYCTEWLERPGQEIDNVGLSLLVDVLLKPVNFILEIAVLDRTPGTQLNTFRFPAEATGADPSTTLGPVIYLLFRPGHYDILYRAPVEVPTHFVAFISNDFKGAAGNHALDQGAFCTFDFTPFYMMPGFTVAPPTELSALSTSLDSPGEHAYTPSPISPWVPSPPCADTLPTPPPSQAPSFVEPTAPDAQAPLQAQAQAQAQALPQGLPLPLPQPEIAPATPRPIRRRKRTKTASPPQSERPPIARPALPPGPTRREGVLRFSEFTYKSLEDRELGREPVFQAPVYQNSHFNTAHYNNPNFQPEEYCPGINEDGTVNRVAGLRKRSGSPSMSEARIPIRKKTL